MALTEDRQKELRDVAVGHKVDAALSVDDQIAALRKQVRALTDAAGIEAVEDFASLEAAVVDAKQ